MVSCVEIYLISTMYSCLGLSSSDHSFMSELILAISLTDSDRLASPFSFSPSDSSERSSAASLRPCSRSNRLFASLCASSHAICEYIILHSLSWYNAKKEKSHYRIAPSRFLAGKYLEAVIVSTFPCFWRDLKTSTSEHPLW